MNSKKVRVEDIHQVEEGYSEIKSLCKDIDKGHKVGDNVFGKIYGFPPWLVELIETNPPPCLVLSNYFLNYHKGLWGTWGTPGHWYHSWTKKFPHFRIFIIKQIWILNISI